jgi:hypothetical protein
MQELYLRLGQGTALTYGQEDENFKRLKAAIDALEISVAGAGLGTVTSVGLSLPNIFTVSGSPVTTTGSLTATLASQSGNLMFASPNGTSGQPAFRSLVANDLPVVPIAKGGLGLTTVATNNQVIASNGTTYEGRTISVNTGLTLTQGTGSILFGLDLANISLTSLGGVLTPSQGGTGVSALPSDGYLLIGNTSGWVSAPLTAGTGISITNAPGSITISTSGSVTTAGGIAGTLPIFTTSSSIGNSLVTYTSAFGTGNLTFASGEGGSKIEAIGTVSGEVRASGTSGTNVTYITANASESTLGWTNAKPLNFVQGSTTRATFDASGNYTINTGFKVFASGNSQFLKGFAIDGFVYFNTTGNYTFATSEQYGVILGTGSDGTMSVALPTAPMDGQEICILCEEAKTLTLTSTKTIYGHNAGVAIPIVLTGGGSGAASLLIKYASGANAGAGAWFITGL